MPEQTKENGIQLDIEKDILADAIFETQGRLPWAYQDMIDTAERNAEAENAT
jgi:hypothetical protein